MADDLDDEWWLGNETTNEESKVDSAEDEGSEGSLHRKRKAEDLEEQDEEEEKAQKKKKRKRKKKVEEITQKEIKPLVPEDMIVELSKHYDGKLSTVEWDDLALDGDAHFGFCNNRPGDQNSVCTHLKLLYPKWKKLVKKDDLPHGTPLLLILTGSGIRSANLIRDISEFSTENAKVAKLFSKHLKLEDQMKYLISKTVHIGIGTPARIATLIENDVLHLDQVKYIVLDWSFRDIKLRRMVDIPEVKKDLFSVLKTKLIPYVKRQGSKTKFSLL